MIIPRHSHKRSSSQWVPPSAPLHNPISIFKGRSCRHNGSRMIQPNHLFTEARYDLYNYRQFTNNVITTTKYSLLTFIPWNIYHQITNKYSNLYFIFIAALNFIPMFTAYSKYLGLIPITFVISTTLIKDAIEDLRRWKFDSRINNRTCHVWDRDRQMFRRTKWKYILVGDFVHISNEHELPADILFLRSSDPNGTCFVETSNLDGETSLKLRIVPKRYLSYSQENSNFVPSDFTGTVFSEPPVKAIYTVRAKIEYETGSFEVILKENMLLRGSRLRNTTFIEGIVLYAGHDTKVMMNNGRAPYKISNIERLTNKFTIICIIILVLMCIAGGIGSAVWMSHHVDLLVYNPIHATLPLNEGLINTGVFIICYQTIVPISLYITVEIIKAAQIYFIGQDIDLYDEELDHRIDCRSMNIPEELGQITHVLSDKTGTLTENVMVFRNCSFDETDYGKSTKKIHPWKPVVSHSLHGRVLTEWRTNKILRHFFFNMVLNNSVVVNKKPHQDAIEAGFYEAEVYNIGNSAFFDVTLEQFKEKVDSMKNCPMQKTLRRNSISNTTDCESLSTVSQTEKLPTSMTSNSTPVSCESDMGGEKSITAVSRVSSISKIASVVRKNFISPIVTLLPRDSKNIRKDTVAMKDFCPFEAESPDELAIIFGTMLYGFKLEGKSATYTTISLPDGKRIKFEVLLVLPFDSLRKRMSVLVRTSDGPLLYCKGADSAIFPRIKHTCASDNVHSAMLQKHLNTYSCRGLRTLCFSMRQLSEEQYNEFEKSYRFLMEDASIDREQMLSQKADEVEKDMQLLGVTGIEDRLQDGVEETIIALRNAGIQVWILTGDKLETAENIARSSGLFEDNQKILKIEEKTDIEQDTEKEKYNVVLSPQAVDLVRSGNERMIDILTRAKCVLCYRMTPSEKAEIVKAVKYHLKGTVLAIGDGANDVSMIQAANVGIGVAGKEGMQAVMACDFAIARFRLMQRLLLVHGHWSYYRLANSFLYLLYKNIASIFVLFFFQMFNGNSGSYVIDSTYSILYPIIFTSVQPIIVGVLDQDHPATVLVQKPSYYASGREGKQYTSTLFIINVVNSIWQAAVIYFVCHLCLDGLQYNLWMFGFYLATGTTIVNTLHLALDVRYWTWPLLYIFIFFILLHFIYFELYSILVQTGWIVDSTIYMFPAVMEQATFWLSMPLVTVIALIPKFVVKTTMNSLTTDNTKENIQQSLVL